MEYKVGMKVKFGRPNGQKTYGEIVKVNRTRVKIRQTEHRGVYKSHAIGTVWTVPMSDKLITVLE